MREQDGPSEGGQLGNIPNSNSSVEVSPQLVVRSGVRDLQASTAEILRS